MYLHEYSTDELERLTTLRGGTVKSGEVFVWDGVCARGPFVRTNLPSDKIGAIVEACGLACYLTSCERTPARRVRSFDDLTELDPPQAEMLAELARRSAKATISPLDLKADEVRKKYAEDKATAEYHRTHCVKPVPEVIWRWKLL